MSSSPGNREVAHRLFAAEFEDADFSYSESDEERAPNYVVTPTGARVNRLLAVGVLTEVAPAGESILRARVVDPTGAFVVYAGQYQPEAMAFLESAETPSFVAVTGKARTFQPDDSDVVYTSVRPESVSEVDAATRDRWTVTTAERTLERLGTMGAALDTGLSGDALREALAGSGADASLAAGIAIALREYGTGEAYLDALQSLSLDALRQVAGDVDEVGDLTVAPSEAGGAFSPAVTVEVDASAAGTDAGAAAEASATGEASVETTDTTGGESEASPGGTSEAVSTEGSAPDAEPEGTTADVAAEAGAEVESDSTGSAADAEPDFEGVDAAGDVGSTEAETAPEADDEAAGNLDAEEYEMDDETRQEVEEEYGVEFETAAEVGEAGEADIETPEPAGEAGDVEPAADPDSEPEPEPDSAPESAADDEPDFEAVEREPEPEPEAADDEPDFEPGTGGAADSGDASGESEEVGAKVEAGDEEPADEEPVEETADPTEDADVETVLLSTMEDLDDGDGAPRDELVPAVADATGASESEVEDAIQALLMSGQCYEPDDDRFKPI